MSIADIKPSIIDIEVGNPIDVSKYSVDKIDDLIFDTRTEFLKLLKEKNGEINNLDVTIICEEPKISKYTKKIQNNLSKLLNIEEERISLKATTTEGLGFTGRKEGIAVMSNILVNIKS